MLPPLPVAGSDSAQISSQRRSLVLSTGACTETRLRSEVRSYLPSLGSVATGPRPAACRSHGSSSSLRSPVVGRGPQETPPRKQTSGRALSQHGAGARCDLVSFTSAATLIRRRVPAEVKGGCGVVPFPGVGIRPPGPARMSGAVFDSSAPLHTFLAPSPLPAGPGRGSGSPAGSSAHPRSRGTRSPFRGCAPESSGPGRPRGRPAGAPARRARVRSRRRRGGGGRRRVLSCLDGGARGGAAARIQAEERPAPARPSGPSLTSGRPARSTTGQSLLRLRRRPRRQRLRLRQVRRGTATRITRALALTRTRLTTTAPAVAAMVPSMCKGRSRSWGAITTALTATAMAWPANRR